MRNTKTLVIIAGLLLSSVALAEQWKPLCIEGGVCKNLSYRTASPMPTSQGFLLNYYVVDYSSRRFVNKLILSTPEGLTAPSSFNDSTNDSRGLELPDGKILSFGGAGFTSWHSLEDEPVHTDYSGAVLGEYNRSMAGTPGIIDGSLYVMAGNNSGGPYSLYLSDDEGVTWYRNRSELHVISGPFKLLKNPEGTALWANSSDWENDPGSLWESADKAKSWKRVDDGSFPANTWRVLHDPMDSARSYALTGRGLFLSLDRGVSWQETELTDPIYSLLFIEREDGEPRLVIIGTDKGVRMSIDEMDSWTDISSGLLAQPHSVTFGDGQLIATSESGYYSCELMDCFGAAQAMPAEEDRGLVDVVEFYHPDLDHYFITATDEEATAIDQGAAGAGWIRTGEQFSAYSLGDGDQYKLTDVCRFYGSLKPGPNSHFYSASASECKFLMDLQALVPAHKPNWHFEGYAFTVPPVAPSGPPCPEDAIPVYRAYNNGFDLGIDSNHRFMTDPDLVAEMVEKGWIDEGVAFCSPES